jgi:hypothetical protein
MSVYVNSRYNISNIEQYGYQHYWVNHKEFFVSPIDNDIHTNNIERVWRSLRGSISHIRRTVPNEKIDVELSLFNFRYNNDNQILLDLFLYYSTVFYLDKNTS